MLRADQIINPFTGQVMDKYESTWWHLLRGAKKYNRTYAEMEVLLENEPLVFTQTPKLAKIKDIDFTRLNLIRAGVILYTIVDDEVLLGLGLDKTYQELTDFSGGISQKEKHTPVVAALRELCEETLELYCNINVDDIQNNLALYDRHHLVIFYKVNEDIDMISQRFKNIKQQYKNKIEIDDIVWLTPDQLFDAMIHHQYAYVYIRLANLLIKAGDFYDDLYYLST